MDAAAAQQWLDRYVAAWRSNEPDEIAALFTPDAEYRYGPFDDPIVGADAIVEEWLDADDEPGSWHAVYRVFAVDGDRVVATGRTTYADDAEFANCFLLTFDGERCASFVDYYVEE